MVDGAHARRHRRIGPRDHLVKRLAAVVRRARTAVAARLPESRALRRADDEDDAHADAAQVLAQPVRRLGRHLDPRVLVAEDVVVRDDVDGGAASRLAPLRKAALGRVLRLRHVGRRLFDVRVPEPRRLLQHDATLAIGARPSRKCCAALGRELVQPDDQAALVARAAVRERRPPLRRLPRARLGRKVQNRREALDAVVLRELGAPVDDRAAHPAAQRLARRPPRRPQRLAVRAAVVEELHRHRARLAEHDAVEILHRRVVDVALLGLAGIVEGEGRGGERQHGGEARSPHCEPKKRCECERASKTR